MNETEYQSLVTTCRSLTNDQKVYLIRALLGDRSIEVNLPSQEERVLSISTDSVTKLLDTIADSLASRGGGRLRFELYREIESLNYVKN
ncbi:hypothetical protein [Scytonema sp. PCC 10023]|uniref:hypothetical protein n=1 Tax=Scytonema sp. PCC 10023 TaxID=1680591 RepID=UPI0039C75CF3